MASKTLSAEHKRHISEGLLNSDRVYKPHTDEAKQKISESLRGRVAHNKGKKMPKLVGNTNGFKKGCVPWNKGQSLTDEHKQHLSDNHADFRAEKGGNWLGGKSFEPYCSKFNNRLKEQIRDRDNRTCQLCGAVENGKKLDVHHIHYDKENCEPDLIALCRRCHVMTNHNRDHYEELFMENLINRNITEMV